MKTNAFVTLVLSLFIQKHYTAIPQVFAFIRTSPTRLLQTPTHTKSHSLLTVINKHGNISSTTLSLKRKLTIVNQSPTNQLQDINDGVSQQDQDVDFVIVGAGPAGLLSSIMLAKKFPEKTINVYDRLSEPPSPTDESVWSDVARFYLIGLGARGQTALKKYNVWGDVKNVCTSVVGRKDWGPDSKADEGVERIFTDRPVTTEVLPRDKLVGVLHKHVIDNYAGKINLNYGYEVTPETFDSEDGKGVIVRVSKCSEKVVRMNPTTVTDSNKDVLCDIDDSFTLNTELLIAADGTSRTIANAIEKDQQEKKKSMNIFQKLLSPKQFHVKRYVDDNQRVYKTIPFKAPSGWRPDLNYSARSKGGRINFDALPADRNGSYCGVLLVRANDEVAAANTDPKVLRALMDEKLPQFSSLLDDKTLAAIAKKPPSFLPSFRYAGPQLHYGDHTLILGDCAHTVKPYFGLGANSALEDVKILEEAIDETSSLSEAVHLFSKKRARDSVALVKISRELDRPGKLGILTFIIPIILDSIFHKMLPKLFAPNTISMLQKENITFRGVRRRKRLDRIGQIALLSVFFSGMTMTVKRLIAELARLTGKNSAFVATSGFGLVLTAVMFKPLLGILNPRQAPADVLAKTKDKVIETDTTFSKPHEIRPNEANEVLNEGAGI